MDDVQLYNNVFSNNSALNQGGAFYSMSLWERIGNTVLGNTVLGNTVLGNTVLGNTIVNNYAGNQGAVLYHSQSRDTFVNNIIWNNRTAVGSGAFEGIFKSLYMDHCAIDIPDRQALIPFYATIWDTLAIGNNMLYNQIPDFRDTAAGDFRLRSCSPLLNRGSAEWVIKQGIEWDFTGEPRILQGLPDLGAYETNQSIPTPVFQTGDATGATAANGSARVFSVSGGVPPYQYQWSNGQTGDEITGVLPGLYTLSVTDRYGCRNEAHVRISYLSNTAGPAAQAALRPYPNPSTEQFWIKAATPPHAVALYDARGVLVRRFTTPDVAAGMSVSGLPTGLYRAAIQTQEGVVWHPLAVAQE